MDDIFDSVEDRLKWSIDMQREHAMDLYKEIWNVKEVVPVDEAAEENEEMKALDYSGIDKVLEIGRGRPIHIAQRFRRPRPGDDDDNYEWKLPDFSIRTDSYVSNFVEYDKLKENYQGLGWTPTVYGFGRAAYGRRVALKDGFKEFYIIDVDQFLKCHFETEEIKIVGNPPNDDGSAGAYFNLKDLKDNDCIIETWELDTWDIELGPMRPDDKGNISEWANIYND